MQITRELPGLATHMFKVTTSMGEGGRSATAVVDETRHLESPMNSLSKLVGGSLPGQGKINLPTNDFEVTAGAGSSVHDAITALEELGSKHGVSGVSVPDAALDAGGITRVGSGLSISGGHGESAYGGVGRAAATDLTAAARNVLAALGIG